MIEPERQTGQESQGQAAISAAVSLSRAREKETHEKEINPKHEQPKPADYRFALSPELDLSQENWKRERLENGVPALNSTPQGRAAIRMFSRGVMGAGAFAIGGRFATRQLDTYNPRIMPENWVQALAKTFDNVLGKPIKGTVNLLGGNGERFVTFRPTREEIPGFIGIHHQILGGTHAAGGAFSLGQEMVLRTFDFACASIGDAMGRDMVDALDPNIKKSWKRDDMTVDSRATVKSLGKAAWRYLTLNQGEDWAVALPYVYYIRLQRKILDHAFPGFRMDSDLTANGSTHRIDNIGKLAGNNMFAGAIDLQGRFMGYNDGTKKYQKLYAHLADQWKQFTDPAYAEAEAKKPKSLEDRMFESPGTFARWLGCETVISAIGMAPAVPFFWITRTPQSSYRSAFVNDKEGYLIYGDQGKLLHANQLEYDKAITPETPVYFSKTGRRVPNPLYNGQFKPFEMTHSLSDAVFNRFGKVNYDTRKRVVELSKMLPWEAAPHVAHSFANAAISYTPYMYMKAETANLWDNPRTDVAALSLVDGLFKADGKAIKKGLSAVRHAIMHAPLPDPAQEAEAQLLTEFDKSPTDGSSTVTHEGMRRQKGAETYTQRIAREREDDPEERTSLIERNQRRKIEAHANFAEFAKRGSPSADYQPAV